MSQKSSALSILFEGGEGPLQIEFTNIATIAIVRSRRGSKKKVIGKNPTLRFYF
jgi:hypothetical protein